MKEGENFLKKERERKRKYYVPVAKLSQSEAVKRRKETLARVKRCIKKKKNQGSIDGDGPDTGKTRSTAKEKLILKLPFRQGGKGTGVKKRYRTSLRTAYRKINTLECENQNLHKQNKRIQKRLERAKQKEQKETGIGHTERNTTANTPRSITIRQMQEDGLDYEDKKHEIVRKRLLFANVMAAEIKNNSQNVRKNKLSSHKILSGKIIKKYRCAREFERQTGISRKTLRKSIQHISQKKVNTIKSKYGDLVVSFLEREDNCTIMAGKKDTKKVGRETHQKRILNDYMHNLYDKFRLEHPLIKISKAVFYRLRPKQLMLVTFSRRATCLCMRHQNMSLKLRALRNIGAKVNINPDNFLASNESSNEYIEEIFKNMIADNIEYTEWKKVQENGKNRCKQVQSSMAKAEFVEAFLKQVNEFQAHVERVKNQYSAMRTLRESMNEDVLVWMDFAENFTCSAAEEVQSAYWNTEMVTLHTQVVYFPKNYERSHLSVVGVSSVLSHNAIAVTAMLRKLIPMVIEVYPALKTIHYLTDSPTSQYRNKTIFNLTCMHEKEFGGIQARWDYLEAGHGKGPCDGLGASVKRSADMAIKQGKATIQSAEDFYTWASQDAPNNSSVSYFYVSQDDYNTCANEIKAKSSLFLPVVGTMRAHAVVPVREDTIAVREKSCHCKECLEDVTTTSCNGWTTHRIRKIEEEIEEINEEEVTEEQGEQLVIPSDHWTTVTVDICNFVACVYEHQWYVGRVIDTDIAEEEINVEFMARSGKAENVFKWPHPKDELWIPNTAVLLVIEEPQPCGKTKRMYKVERLEEIENLFQLWLRYH